MTTITGSGGAGRGAGSGGADRRAGSGGGSRGAAIEIFRIAGRVVFGRMSTGGVLVNVALRDDRTAASAARARMTECSVAMTSASSLAKAQKAVYLIGSSPEYFVDR